MAFPTVTVADWRALVEKELAGKPFDKALVHETPEGIPIAPLYTEAPPGQPRDVRPRRFRVCMRHEAGASAEAVAADIDEGADAVWLPLAVAPAGLLGRAFAVLDVDDEPSPQAIESAAGGAQAARFALHLDPLGQQARGQLAAGALADRLAALGRAARLLDGRFPAATAAMVSTLPYHDAGADAADELAIALSAGARYLGALLEAGLSPAQAARQIAVQIAVGRDTFVELSKMRALRVCWQKLLAAAGAPGAPAALVHAVCSSRTLAVRDPWVNMLRTTTQVFAAVLGGADLVTPSAFDQVFGPPSPLGRRVARNTGLVLREESFLGKVADPAGGSYYFEALTDALAREAWRRFQALEREGGVAAALSSGQLAARLASAWTRRLKQLAARKVPVLGVSEFANLTEALPRPAPAAGPEPPPGALPQRRDAAAFEALRARAEASPTPPEALLVTLGSFAESRPRAGFAAGFFAAGGIKTRESAQDERAAIVCLCGSDERYAAEAAERARSLKALGAGRVLLAGRPGAQEGPLREAGVDGFLYLGCDAVELLSELLGAS